MPLALDTNVVVDLVRRQPLVRANYIRALKDEAKLMLSSIVLQELLYGVEISGDPAREEAKLAQVLNAVEVVPFESADAEAGGRAQAVMRRQGRKAPPLDFLVGAHALARDTTLVTANTRHFENIPGLKLLDWRQPPEEFQD